MNQQYKQVQEFHKAFGEVMPDKPTMLTKNGESHFFGLEVAEMSQAIKNFSIHEGKTQVNDRASWMLEELAEFMQAETLEDQADALIDLIYFAIGTFTLMGVNPDTLFNIVHEANMGKVGPDGVQRNAQGKIVKPEGWAERYAPEPRIIAEIERQATK